MSSPRGTTNTAIRGSAEGRRRSKRALLARDGDGVKAPCWECGTVVDFATMVRDKIKPGREGGRYVLTNLRVHCSPCSMRQGHRMGLETRRWKAWEKRGLRRSQISPAGRRERGVWFVYLDGVSVGYLLYGMCGKNWTAYQFDGPEGDLAGQELWDGTPVTDPGDRRATKVGLTKTRREATYALLVECTTNQKGKAA
jgi:hypothetical protein